MIFAAGFGWLARIASPEIVIHCCQHGNSNQQQRGLHNRSCILFQHSVCLFVCFVVAAFLTSHELLLEPIFFFLAAHCAQIDWTERIAPSIKRQMKQVIKAIALCATRCIAYGYKLGREPPRWIFIFSGIVSDIHVLFFFLFRCSIKGCAMRSGRSK